MIHKTDVAISTIAMTVLMCINPAINNFAAAHVYMIPLLMIGIWLGAYISVLLIVWIFFAAVSATINIKKEYPKHSRFYGIVFSLLMENAAQLCSADITVTGMEKLPKPSEGRFLFVSNHISIYDTFIQVGAFRRYPLAFISKPENFNIPIGHRYMTRCGYMAIDREDVRSGAKITKKAADMISSGDSCVGVYPEGTRNRTEDKLIEFKHGCFKSAVWAKSPIVIGVVHNSNNIKHGWLLKRTKVHFEIVEVMPYEMFKDWTTVQISAYVKDKMLERLS